MTTSNPRAPWAVGLALTLLLAACGGGGGGGETDPGTGTPPVLPTGSIAGRIEVLSGVPGVVFETEPNDAFDEADFAAHLPVGGRLTLFGEVDEPGGDVRDGFRLRARPRLRILANLKVQDPTANDVTLQVVDPVALRVVESFGAAEAAAGVTFHAQGDFDLVVEAHGGAGAYELALAADPPFSPLREREPNDDASHAAYLGQVLEGETLTLEGSLDAAADPADGFLLLVPASSRLACRLDHPAFTSYAVLVEDATAGGASAPLALARFEGAAGGVQVGEVDVAGGTLVHVAATSASGSGAWRLVIEVLPPSSSLVGATSAGLAPVTADASYLRGERAIEPGEAVVCLRAPSGGGAGLARFGARLEGVRPGAVHRVLLDLPPAPTLQDRRRATWRRIRALAAHGDVAWVEPNYRVHPAREPDDTYYGLQWHYDLIDLPRAWDITTGDPSVIVAVVDTGRTSHPDLVGRQIAGYDLISNPAIAGDGDGIDSDPTDVGDGGASGRHSWHGTHVAGTIGASTDDGRGVAGVTWATQIMHVRALGIGGGTTYDVANAILYAAGLPNSSQRVPARRADVVNLSLGGGAYSQTLADACAAARSAGVLLVAAAGNSNASAPFYPAALPSVVSVMAVDAGALRAPYSNYGSTVDLAAPGGDLGADRNADGYADGVLSTLWTSSGTAGYAFYHGTSMASPQVAGVAALLLGVDPTLDPASIESILRTTATDLGAAGRDDVYGYGLVNAYEALLEVGGPPPPTPPELHVRPRILNFGRDIATLDVQIANFGGSFLDIEEIRVTTTTGGAWLDAALAGAPSDALLAPRLTVRVTRTGLLTGTYLGRVELVSNGGTVPIDVVMGVATHAAPAPNLDVFVVAMQADSGVEVARTSVNPAGSLAFSFPALPAGRYVLQAGTDVDGDGILGEDGDYVGAYPLPGQPIVLEVVEGVALTGRDFDVTFAPTLDGVAR